MENTIRKAWGGLVFIVIVLGFLLFLPAGTFFYWQAWIYLVVLALSIVGITIYLIIKDPALLKRRISVGANAEKEKSQKIIQFIGQFAFISCYIISSLDHRFGWSTVSFPLVIFSDIMVLLGFYIVFLVFKQNTFTSAVIEVAEEQKVISTGPYALVRHPMYSGTLLVLFATPIALGSYWGLLAFIPITYIIIWRLREEEKFLAKNLHGYTEYCNEVHWRLVPGFF